ncbi:zinc ribbon domain-containing protein [Patescibacteria group bacterium]|nr:zinc ribbon domain-containing protein [Patescibacteria group bacterium]
MTCGDCGCGITAEYQKDYIYYHCSFYRKCSQHRYTREKDINKQVFSLFGDINIGEKAGEIVKRKIMADRKTDDNLRKKRLGYLQKRYGLLDEWIDQIYDDKAKGLMDEAMYQRKYNEYKAKRKDAKESLEDYENGNFDTFELSTNLVDLSIRASDIYKKREPEDKRLLLNLILSNAVLKDKKLDYSLNIPYNYIVEYKKTENWSGIQDSNL